MVSSLISRAKFSECSAARICYSVKIVMCISS